jgi:hypothetical protein
VEIELCEKSKCGPAPAYPNAQCPDGIHQDGRGPCVYRDDGSCGWFRLKCPPPGGSQPKFVTSDPLLLLQSWDAADRIRGAKLVRANKEGLSVRKRSDKYASLLNNCLSFQNDEVRLWAVMAMATLDDRKVKMLQRARQRQTSQRVIQQIDAALGKKTKPARVVTAKECTKKNRKKMKKWPVRELCDPIGRYPPILFPLGDGTNIYQGRGTGPACFRGKRKKRCYVKCLPGESLIETPEGPTPVRDLRAGDLVWSFDAAGNRVTRPIEKVGSDFAGSGHRLVEVSLSDGRVVRASAPHPTASGLLGELEVGSALDGARVLSLRSVPLDSDRTFDLLPAGETGLYIADGVILGSSLRPALDP